jgi:hypothetical protein
MPIYEKLQENNILQNVVIEVWYSTKIRLYY